MVKAKPTTEWERPSGPAVLLSGGNPQVPLGYGQEPVDYFIEACPGWKSGLARQLDDLITQAVPGVQKAVKWNTPMYGVEPDRYFAGFHCLNRYIKVSFHQGSRLEPLPPGTSKQAAVRYLDIYEDDVLDEGQFIDWMQQASRLGGEKM
jgi:hypothetical protein